MNELPPELLELICAYLPEWDFRSLFQVTQVSSSFPLLRELFDTQSFWICRVSIQYNIKPEAWHKRWILESGNIIIGHPFAFRYAEVVSRNHVVLESPHFIPIQRCLERALQINDPKLIETFIILLNLGDHFSLIWADTIVKQAALYGHFDLFKQYLESMGGDRLMAAIWAGQGGHHDIIDYTATHLPHYQRSGTLEKCLLEGGHVSDFDEVLRIREIIGTDAACIALLTCNRLDFLDRLRQLHPYDFSVYPDHWFESAIAKSGSKEVFDYANTHLKPVTLNGFLVSDCIDYGSKDLLMFLDQEYHINDRDRMFERYANASPEILEWYLTSHPKPRSVLASKNYLYYPNLYRCLSK